MRNFLVASVSVVGFISLASTMALSDTAKPAPKSLGSYDHHNEWVWQPVAIGAGGWMRGMVMHPHDSNIRYARSDTWGAYRWDPTRARWQHMVTAQTIPPTATVPDSDTPGSVFKVTAYPSEGSIDSIAIDPQLSDRVYMAGLVTPPTDITLRFPNNRASSVYYSTDRGLTFKPSTGLSLPSFQNVNCSAKELEGQNTAGERLRVDPRNSNVVYLGSALNGVFASADAGHSFQTVTGGGVPAACQSVLSVVFDGSSIISRTINGTTQAVSKNIYLVVDGASSGVATTGVFQSRDGGISWADIAAKHADGSGGIQLGHNDIGSSTIDSAGHFFITSGGAVYKYTNGNWSVSFVPNDSASTIAVDPNNNQRIFVVSRGTGTFRSLDGGSSWIPLGSAGFIKSGDNIYWITARPKDSSIVSSLMFDGSAGTAGGRGRLWASGGNDGVIYADLDDVRQQGASSGPKWIEKSKGIEQLVGQNVIIPPGGNNTAVVTAEDEAEFYISNPQKFNAKHYDVDLTSKGNNGLGTNGMVAFSPDTPSVMVTNPANLFAGGYRGGPFRNNFAGYSVNYGQHWQLMPSITLTDNDNTGGTGSIINTPIDLVGGQIAISARGTVFPGKGQPVWTGQDNIVWLSFGSQYDGNGSFFVPPRYSFDGGKAWRDGTVFDENGRIIDFTPGPNHGSQFIFNNAAKQFALVADPVMPKTFYALGVRNFMVTHDGGKTWTMPNGSIASLGLGYQLFIKATLKAVPGRTGDLWLSTGSGADGVAGNLYHSINGGTRWQRVVTAKTYAVAIGKAAAGSEYALYMYGKPTETHPYGIYRSNDKGGSWSLISGNGVNGYPFQSFDLVYDLAASQDREGLVYMSFGGMSYGWGYQKSVGNPYPR